jgi:hypothetical protein
MNLRIQELLLKAGWDRYEALDERNQKFAELLLKDCVSNVEAWEKDSRNHISYMLKNHYEIEV